MLPHQSTVSRSTSIGWCVPTVDGRTPIDETIIRMFRFDVGSTVDLLIQYNGLSPVVVKMYTKEDVLLASTTYLLLLLLRRRKRKKMLWMRDFF